MNAMYPQPDETIGALLRRGIAIPAHPLALTASRVLDERRQMALSRYYLAAGAGGLAVGVHTTQFAIRDEKVGLLRPVLELAAAGVREHADTASSAAPAIALIAGVCGKTRQAVCEAACARELGYHAGLLSLGALKDAAEAELVEHAQEVAREIPLFGFYLQPSVGGRLLSYDFWRRFAEIPNVIAIKVAPFNRYQTLDVVRAVAASSRWADIALYTGNDDTIVADLLAEYRIEIDGQVRRMRFAGGLLGHWACWTHVARQLLDRCHQLRDSATDCGHDMYQLLQLGHQVTDMNAAIFDAANRFRGCIPGIHEVLRRQGLLAGNWCLDPKEQLSPGQADEITRVCQSYPDLVDDQFIRENLGLWLT